MIALVAGSAQAQPVFDPVEDVDFDRPESWAMKFFGSLTSMTGFGVPRDMEPGEVEISFEGGLVPSLSREERRVGFNGQKVEDLNRSSVLGRPRVTFGLPAKLSLTLGYVPPVEIDGMEPNILTLGLGRSVWSNDSARVGLRLAGQVGKIKGDLVCAESDVGVPDPDFPDIVCEAPSNDEVRISSAGLEVSASLREDSKWQPYFAVGITYFDMETRLDARYAGIIDRTTLKTDGTTFSVTAGLGYQVAERWRLAGELYYSPLDVVRPPDTSSRNDALFNARGVLIYRLR